jgi:squalene synthase HpnC
VVNAALTEAYAYCERLARSHYENFPVASRLLPSAMRPHIAAIYAFARVADDMADEGDRPAANRLADLDAWGRRLDDNLRSSEDDRREYWQVFAALRQTIEQCRLPVTLLHDLLSAFAQDVTTKQYATWPELLDYCRRSANPVGRLVLRVAGYGDGRLDAASDAVCTALQLTNFWQDVEIDRAKGRLYMPINVWQPLGARIEDLDAGRMTDAWRAAFADVVVRTRELFAAGIPVVNGVHGRLRFELRATWLGGTRILDKLEAANYDMLSIRPALTRADLPSILWRTALWQYRG